MATYTKETALYDTGAIATDILNAGTTATSYITQVDSQGIWVTPSALKPTNTETGAGATGARINADGMEIFQNGDAVAHYGDYARIGKEGEANTRISPSEVSISAGNNINALRITPDGNTQSATFTKYINKKILAGASFTYTHPSNANSNTQLTYWLTTEASGSKAIVVTKGQTTATTTVTSPFKFEYSATTSAITIKNNESSIPIILSHVVYRQSSTVPLIEGGGVLALGASPRVTDLGTVFAVGNGTASFNAFTVFDTGLVTIHGGVGSVGSITLDGRTGYVEINGEQVWPVYDTGWETLTLSSGSGTLQYRWVGKIVYIVGTGLNVTHNTNFVTLPAAIRPTIRITCSASFPVDKNIYINLYANGQMAAIQNGGGSISNLFFTMSYPI